MRCCYTDGGSATLLSLISSPSPRRAATLVRKTKGENKMGRNHPLRCGRQRWYGGNQGMGTRGWGAGEGHSRRPPPHHAVNHTRTRQSAHPPPPLTTRHQQHSSLTHFLPSRARCFLLLLPWTDLCMPLLDPTVGSVQRTKLHDVRAERRCS